jgi:release factor glutamine methyltransferase
MEALSPDVRDWEPAMALTPGPEGLESYRALIPQAADRLAPGGQLLLEIGAAQGAAVAGLCHDSGLAQIAILPDLDGRDRVVCARNRV